MAVDWRKTASVLVHPLAVEILERCDGQSRSPTQLARTLDVPVGRLSYHFRQLADKDLLILVDTVPRRGALEHFYRTSELARKSPRKSGSVQGVERAA